MRHRYLCPMRWADLDALGHVNNVTWVDYLQEARVDMLGVHAALTGAEALAEGVVVVNLEARFLAPMGLRREPLAIECWVTEVRAASFTLAYEIFDEDPEAPQNGRRVYLRASSVLAPYVFAEERPRRLTPAERTALAGYAEDAGAEPVEVSELPPGRNGHGYDLYVRFSDVDAYGHVNNVKYFEFFSEARIRYLADLRPEGAHDPGSWVLARHEVVYLSPILHRSAPYAVTSWIESVGEKSAVVCAEIADGEQVLARARAVIVGYDPQTQAAAPMQPGQRELLLAELG